MRFALLALPILSVFLVLAACAPETKPPKPHPPIPGQTGVTPTPSPSPSEIATPTPEPSPEPDAVTPTPSPAPTTGTIPYGTPVPGKQGYVISPYSPGSGYVDVRGFPPNSEVKDPYSGKTFLVP